MYRMNSVNFDVPWAGGLKYKINVLHTYICNNNAHTFAKCRPIWRNYQNVQNQELYWNVNS